MELGDGEMDLSLLAPAPEIASPANVEFARTFVEVAELVDGEGVEDRNSNINQLLNSDPEGVDPSLIEMLRATIKDGGTVEDAAALARDLIPPPEETKDLSDLLGDDR